MFKWLTTTTSALNQLDDYGGGMKYDPMVSLVNTVFAP
jgi:hypothetical protein